MSIPDAVSSQAFAAPERTAVVFGHRRVSFRELDARAGHLAHALARKGIGLRDVVGVCIERSPELIVAELAVMKCGAAYLPLDPHYPAARIAAMESQAGVKLTIDDVSSETSLRQVYRSCAADEDDPAAILFTSGSTGEPKGVALSHRSILRLMDGAWVPFAPGDVVGQTAHACFDLCAFETWFALTNGLTLVMVPLPVLLSPDLLAQLIRDERVTHLVMTTALFHEIAAVDPAAFTGVRTLIVGGDVLDPGRVRQVMARSRPTRLINGYGPAENGVFSTSYECHALPLHATDVPIGLPVPGTVVYLLGPDRRPVADGEIGDLYVGGAGLTAGYLNRPDLTADRFIPDPFDTDPAVMIYDTGDRARRLNGGDLQFCGRTDSQVKIRGFRVEPQEVEAVLLRHPAVVRAAVVPTDTVSGPGLAAFVEIAASSTLDGSAIRAFACGQLPDYMAPSTLSIVDRLPMTATGKVDRLSLTTEMASYKKR